MLPLLLSVIFFTIIPVNQNLFVESFLSDSIIAINSTKGLLYPRETESREVRSLDGIWRFLPCDENFPDRGIIAKWYLNNLDNVSSKPINEQLPKNFGEFYILNMDFITICFLGKCHFSGSSSLQLQ